MLTCIRMSIHMNQSNLAMLLCSSSDDRIGNKMVTSKRYRNTIIGKYLPVLFCDLITSCFNIVQICSDISYISNLKTVKWVFACPIAPIT